MEHEMSNAPKFPEIEVQLSGEDGNAFLIIARVANAMKRADVDPDEIRKFKEIATSGDYDGVIRAAMDFVTVH